MARPANTLSRWRRPVLGGVALWAALRGAALLLGRTAIASSQHHGLARVVLPTLAAASLATCCGLLLRWLLGERWRLAVVLLALAALDISLVAPTSDRSPRFHGMMVAPPGLDHRFVHDGRPGSLANTRL